jgi:hypothetical protein
MAIASDGHWEPDCWHMSDQELISQARALDNAAFASAFAMAGQHSNPTAHLALRPF